MDQVARTLDMDRRTLHRHLAREGESFGSILHATREGLAERHLANDRYSMTDVAHLLGFAAPSAFSRWFHQQFGVSPSEWRKVSLATEAARRMRCGGRLARRADAPAITAPMVPSITGNDRGGQRRSAR